jgi:hypothetical protein
VGLSITVYFRTSIPPCSLNITAFMLLAMDLHWNAEALELSLAAVHQLEERLNTETVVRSMLLHLKRRHEARELRLRPKQHTRIRYFCD